MSLLKPTTIIAVILFSNFSMEWAIKNYLLLMLTLTFMTLVAYLAVLTIDKIKTKK